MDRLLELVYEHDAVADLDVENRRRALAAIAERAGVDDVTGAVATLEAELFGWGPLEDVLSDRSVTDVLVNGPREIWVDRAGRLQRADPTFRDQEHLLECTYRWFGRWGGRVDHLQPIADVTTPDGIRLHAVLPPIAPDGPLLSLRRVAGGAFALDDLEATGCMNEAQRAELEDLVVAGAAIVISGQTGCGKTTLLDALCRLIPEQERVVVIEETPELRGGGRNAVSLVTRHANAEGLGGVPLDDLVRAALRMRPDRIVIGEVRGVEAWPALRALSTGHAGSMLTVHARSAADAIPTLAFVALPGAHGCAHADLTAAFERAVDAVVHMERDGSARRVVAIDRSS